MLTTTVRALLTYVCPPSTKKKGDKVTVIGAGSVGSAIAFTLLAQGVTSELVLIDQNEDLVRGELLDMDRAKLFLNCPNISCSTDYEAAKESSILIITIGARFEEGDNELSAAARNTDVLKEMIPVLVQGSPDAIILIITQPVDVCTYVAWKLSGFPSHRVIGSGTSLESTYFRSLVARRLGVNPQTCQAYVIGQPGDNSIPVWSGVTVSGVRLKDINADIGTADDPEDWREIHTQVVQHSYEIQTLKSCDQWGMALTITRIVNAVLTDSRECIPVSTHIKGCRHKDKDPSDKKDVYLSLPCILGTCGVTNIVRQHLNEKEKGLLQKSADRMNQIQSALNLDGDDEEGGEGGEDG